MSSRSSGLAEKRIVVEIYDHNEINKVPIKKGMWRYALVRDEDGKVVLAEVISMSGKPPKGGKGWCYAGPDTVNRQAFEQVMKEDPDYYDSKTFEEFMAWSLRGIFKIKDGPKKKKVKK